MGRVDFILSWVLQNLVWASLLEQHPPGVDSRDGAGLKARHHCPARPLMVQHVPRVPQLTASTLATCPCQPLGCQLLGTHSYHLLKRAALGQWEPACLEGLEECAHPQEGPWAIVTWCETPAFASEQDNLCDTCHTRAPVGSSMTGYPTPHLFWVLPWPGLLPSPLTSLLRPLPRWTTCTNIPISGPDSGEPNLRCKIPVSSLLLLSILPAYFAQWHSGTFTKPPQICMCMLSCFSHVRTLWPHRLQHSRLPCPFAQTHDIESAI